MERQQRSYWRDVMPNSTWRQIQQCRRPKIIPLSVEPSRKIIPLTVDNSRVLPLTFDDERIIPLSCGEEDIIPLTAENDRLCPIVIE